MLEATNEVLEHIKKRLKDGATQGTIAQELGVTPDWFSRWKLKTPAVKEVVDKAKMNLESEVVGYLFQMIRNPDHKNHASSVYFYLKTQCGWRESSAAIIPTQESSDKAKGMKYKVIEINEKGDETEIKEHGLNVISD